MIPAVVGRRVQQKNAVIGSDVKYFHFGDDALYNRGMLNLKYPTERGVVCKWDDMVCDYTLTALSFVKLQTFIMCRNDCMNILFQTN